MLISLIFFILASISNAVMDTCSHHFSNSVFSKLNPKFWDATISWMNKYVDGNPSKGIRKLFWIINFPVQLTDAWHMFKSLMIIFICASIATFKGYTIYYFEYEWLNIAIAIIVYGTTWNLFFSLYYGYIFKK